MTNGTAKQKAGRRLSPQLLAEVALGVLLALTLGFSWRDGIPSNGDVFAVGPGPSGIAALQVSGNNLHSGKVFLAITPAPPPAPPPEPVIPTARPVQILIPAIDVHRAVELVGTNRSGVLDQPVNAWNAGWYEAGPVPGAPGDAVIEGHAGYPGVSMIFGRLVALKPGDAIIVVLADGTRELFLVDSMTGVPVGTSPPGLAEPYGPPRLTLLTCTGHFDKNSYSYSQRLVLEAHYAGLA